MTIRPLSDRILVKRVAEQQKTAGGLHIPDSAKEKPLEAMIVAVGSGKVQDDGSRQPTSRPATRSCWRSTPAARLWSTASSI